MEINNNFNFKSIDNSLIKQAQTKKTFLKPNLENTIEKIETTIKDTIKHQIYSNENSTDIKNTNIPNTNSTNTIIDNKLPNKDVLNKNLTTNPTRLTILEEDNNSFKPKLSNTIKAFGPKNLPLTPEEMFINPKYL